MVRQKYFCIYFLSLLKIENSAHVSDACRKQLIKSYHISYVLKSNKLRIISIAT